MEALFCLTRKGSGRRAHSLVQMALKRQLGESLYDTLCRELDDLADSCVRASSLVENLNSRLRPYFSLRKRAGSGFCDLLRFFLNQRRLPRSRREHRRGKSPAECLTGETRPHWLEQLGYTLFKRPV